MKYKLDLHIHTKASRCFKGNGLDNDEVNRAIVKQAKNKGLGLIAVTDHYTLKNYSEIKTIASEENINVLPGMELSINPVRNAIRKQGKDINKTGSLLKSDISNGAPEKLSVIIIFSENNSIENLGNRLLSELNVPAEEKGNGRFLINKQLTEIMRILNKYNGLIISAHQDKNETRMLSIPILIKHGVNLFDLRYPDKKEIFLDRYSRYNIIPLTFSDCHEADNVGKYYMSLSLKECSFDGFKKYLENNLRAIYEN